MSKNKIEEEIDLKNFYYFFLRNKVLIFLITLLGTLTGLFFSLNKTSIYNGSFQVIESEAKKEEGNSNFNLINQLSGKEDNKNKTKLLVLKSPIVLLPVYEKAKEEYIKRGQDISSMSYKNWLKSNLDINFEKGTSVLTTQFRDKDKEFILETLNSIYDQYISFSKREREKVLNNIISFLSNQEVLLTEKAVSSLKELNSFSIKNGLGDIDGFVAIGKNNFQKSTQKNGFSEKFMLELNPNLKNNKSESDAGQRFKSQFDLLESYESQYMDYASKLKPNSKFLTNLKLKIDNLRESLKRPNEILIKYRELVKTAERDEFLLNDVIDQLTFYKFEAAKQSEPWQVISKPTIDRIRISPRRKQDLFKAFLISFLIGSAFAFAKEKKSGFIYNLEELKYLIDFKFIETIYNDSNLSKKFIESSLIKKIFNESKKGLIVSTNFENYFIDYFNDLNISLEIAKLSEYEKIERAEEILFIFDSKNTSKKDIFLANKYLKLFNEKIKGWYYFQNNF